MPAGDAFDVDTFDAVPDRELDVLVARLVQVLHDRQCDVPKSGPAWTQRSNLDEPQADAVAAVGPALQTAPELEFADQPVRVVSGSPVRRASSETV